MLMADGIRSELTDTLKRIELPISVPAFGSRSNTVNIKRALLAGFFMQVRKCNLLASILPFSLPLFRVKVTREVGKILNMSLTRHISPSMHTAILE